MGMSLSAPSSRLIDRRLNNFNNFSNPAFFIVGTEGPGGGQSREHIGNQAHPILEIRPIPENVSFLLAISMAFEFTVMDFG